MTTTGDDGTGLFWAGAPLTVNSELFHIYRESDERSLCGQYSHSSLNRKQSVEVGDLWTEGKDCKSCSRKADPVEVDDE